MDDCIRLWGFDQAPEECKALFPNDTGNFLIWCPSGNKELADTANTIINELGYYLEYDVADYRQGILFLLKREL